jgi:hypothetical protein
MLPTRIDATVKRSARERPTMTDTSFTLLEVHLEEGALRIGDNGLLGDGTADEGAASAIEGDDASAAGGGSTGCGLSGTSVLGGLAVVLLLVALGVAAARLLGDGDLEDAEALDDLA